MRENRELSEEWIAERMDTISVCFLVGHPDKPTVGALYDYAVAVFKEAKGSLWEPHSELIFEIASRKIEDYLGKETMGIC